MVRPCDICGLKTSTPTSIRDKRWERIDHSDAQVCPKCFSLWVVGDESLVYRIKHIKWQGKTEEGFDAKD